MDVFRSRARTSTGGFRVLVALALAVGLAATAVSPASAVGTQDREETTSYVVIVDPGVTPAEVLDLVAGIEAGSKTSLAQSAQDIDVVFEPVSYTHLTLPTIYSV